MSVCAAYPCSQRGLFKCTSAKNASGCVRPSFICDGNPDCDDRSDQKELQLQYVVLNVFLYIPDRHVVKKCNGKNRKIPNQFMFVRLLNFIKLNDHNS